MVKIQRLPSGSYRARVHIGGGKYKSITGKDKKTVQLEAAKVEANVTTDYREAEKNVTLGKAIDNYIESKCNVLSPSTIRGYKALRNNAVPELMVVDINDLTPELVQRAINVFAVDKSPKYTRNVHGLISSTLKQYRPDLQLNTTMPQKKKSKIAIPTEQEMQKLFEYVKDTDAELPIYLGACCGMRRSEILGLKWSDIDFENGTISINEALVLNDENKPVSKGTKTVAGTRTIRMFPFVRAVLNKAPKDSKYVVTLKGHQIYQRFKAALQECGIKHYRFHDLRHYLVSVMLSLNIPKNYIASFVGHGTERMIDEVYGHLMASKKTAVEDLLQDYFSNI